VGIEQINSSGKAFYLCSGGSRFEFRLTNLKYFYRLPQNLQIPWE